MFLNFYASYSFLWCSSKTLRRIPTPSPHEAHLYFSLKSAKSTLSKNNFSDFFFQELNHFIQSFFVLQEFLWTNLFWFFIFWIFSLFYFLGSQPQTSTPTSFYLKPPSSGLILCNHIRTMIKALFLFFVNVNFTTFTQKKKNHQKMNAELIHHSRVIKSGDNKPIKIKGIPVELCSYKGKF